MIVGLGIDLIELDRVSHSLSLWGRRLIEKLMDAEEAERLPAEPAARARALALAIAAKESASKALHTGWTRGVRWRDVVLEARAAEVAAALGSDGRTRLRLEVRGNLVLGEVRLLAR